MPSSTHIEARNALARALFFSRLGELRYGIERLKISGTGYQGSTSYRRRSFFGTPSIWVGRPNTSGSKVEVSTMCRSAMLHRWVGSTSASPEIISGVT